ncbi:hypothetical protein EV182_005602, partial [Spiromyces aspiralis]
MSDCIPIFAILICGTTERIKPLQSVNFLCPRCHNLSVVKAKYHSFFTFYWIPIIPLGRRKLIYLCNICGWRAM